MQSTLNKSRKATHEIKAMLGVPMLVKMVNGASKADAIQNTLTITWVFAARAALIVASVEQISYWMILTVSAWAAYIFCRQISRAIIIMERYSSIFPSWLNASATIVTMLLSFGGLADGMFPDLHSYVELLQPRNAMKLLTITVISVAPITTIKVGMAAIMHTIGEAVEISNAGEITIISDELKEVQNTESVNWIEKMRVKIQNSARKVKLTV